MNELNKKPSVPKKKAGTFSRSVLAGLLIAVASVASVAAWYTYENVLCQALDFTDAQFELLVRDLVDQPYQALTTCHVEQIEELSIRKRHHVSRLDGLEAFAQLKELTLWEANIEDISQLEKLNNLERLNIHASHVSDLSPLQSLFKLESLSLSQSPIQSIAPLFSLTNLQNLRLDSTQLSDLNPMIYLSNLRTLTLTNNQISDLSPLIFLWKLERLILAGNPQLENLLPLGALPEIIVLNINSTGVTDLHPLTQMKNLQVISATDNGLTDISPLLNVKKLWNVDLRNNPFADDHVACQVHIPELRSRREVLGVRSNTCPLILKPAG